MAISINAGFHLGAPIALDDRSYLTKAEMLTVNENIYPDYFLTICSDDGFLYMFDKSIADEDKDAETGKFKLFAGDVEEAIKILNGTVDTEGSVLYSIFHNAAAAKYETKVEKIEVINMSAFSVSNIVITEKELNKCKDGETIDIEEDFTMSYSSDDDEFTVTQTSTSTSNVVTITEDELETITTIKKAISNLAEAAEVTVDTEKTTEGYLKTYEIFQGGESVAKIDIPKDLVVVEGKVLGIEEVTNPETEEVVGYKIIGTDITYTKEDAEDEESPYYGYPITKGTYICLVIANQKAPILIDAKDLIDTGSLGNVTEDITANIEVGGIGVGDVVKEGTDITALVKQLLVKYFAPTITLSTNEKLVQRAGTTLTNLILTAKVTKKSEPVTEVLIEGEAVTDDVSAGGTFTKTIPSLAGPKTFTASATDGKKTTPATLTIDFVVPYMYGVLGKNSIDNDADLAGFTEVVEKQGTKTFGYSATNQYCVFMMPAEYADLYSILDPSSFENLKSWTKSEYSTENNERYKVYITNTPVTTSGVFKYTFK